MVLTFTVPICELEEKTTVSWEIDQKEFQMMVSVIKKLNKRCLVTWARNFAERKTLELRSD